MLLPASIVHPDQPSLGCRSISPCPLCGDTATEPFYVERKRDYLRCPACRLIFVPSAFHLPPQQEKAHYDTHQNDPRDSGYRRFLARLADPLAERLAPGASGLDYGCGPGPTLSLMLEERGHSVALYDAYYRQDPGALDASYDFITATEVAEHLSAPGAVFDLLWSKLRPGGWLALMTSMWQGVGEFAAWHYKNDPTHISFFAPETFIWLACRWQVTVEFAGSTVVLFRKS
ncbi:MAG: class I SAM-dependent methyltransferase [Porticoccaceae bacterium]|jgi:SAM-dependent methyltransferase